ncbi:MAG: hypothetical protein R2867_05955 [Caldilineaceae bacterium]
MVDTLNIQWQADDADVDDQLFFTVQYSHDDGVKWHTLVTNYPSNPTKSYALTYDDLGGLPGSAPNAARVRVLASDGFHTTIATSPGFTVQNRKPDVAILNPAPGQNFAAGVAIPLQARPPTPKRVDSVAMLSNGQLMDKLLAPATISMLPGWPPVSTQRRCERPMR